MNIGVITFWQSNDNYGQLLQCWALQHHLRSMGHNAYIIKYDLIICDEPKEKSIWKKLFKAFLIFPIFQHIARKRRSIKMIDSKNKNVLRHFEDFRSEHLRFTDRTYTSLKELQDDPPQADAYIVGSDQVWAHLLNISENEVYYLNFGSNRVKRISYAPSFAMDDYPSELLKRLKINLARFNFLSVREKTGIKICNKVGFKPELVLDPTLLLSKQDYSLLENSHNDKSDYIYLYYLNIDKKKEVYWKQLRKLSKENNLIIKATTASGYIPGFELFNNVQYIYATIPQWLGLIAHAKLVVTTSFHGTVFSIIHHTPFIFIPLYGEFSRGNNRAFDLLRSLGLENRILKDGRHFDALYKQDINWEDVDRLLRQQQKCSFDFLKSSLE